MPRYDLIWAALAERAVRQGGVDAITFMQMALDSGMSEERVMSLLEEDLDTGGPIFGKFLRSIIGAASQSVLAAERQGNVVGAIATDEELQASLGITNVDDIIAGADPEQLAAVEREIENEEYYSVAAFEKTCYQCIALHGKKLTMREWAQKGLLPEQRHAGWDSSCHCTLIPAGEVSRKGLVDPLVRVPLITETGLKAKKRTVRAVLQKDVDKAQNAVERAMETEQGRQTLRILGMAYNLQGEGK